MPIKFSNNLQLSPISYQEFLNSEYIPSDGELVIISDYMMANDLPIPSFTIGDGTSRLKDLHIAGEYTGHALTADTAEVAKSLEHSITIGEHIFNGTEDVTIPIYDGTNEIE